MESGTGSLPVAAMEWLVNVVRLEAQVCIVRLFSVGLHLRV